MFFSALIFGQHLVLGHLQLGPADRALREGDFAVVVGACGALLGFALRDLLFEIVQLGALVEGVLDLVLTIEFDDQVALCDRATRRDEFGDDQ